MYIYIYAYVYTCIYIYIYIYIYSHTHDFAAYHSEQHALLEPFELYYDGICTHQGWGHVHAICSKELFEAV
jgi:hypothetical protein